MQNEGEYPENDLISKPLRSNNTVKALMHLGEYFDIRGKNNYPNKERIYKGYGASQKDTVRHITVYQEKKR